MVDYNYRSWHRCHCRFLVGIGMNHSREQIRSQVVGLLDPNRHSKRDEHHPVTIVE